MAGRRSHPRFVVANPWDGSVRVLRDVIVQRSGPRELVAVSHAPGLVGEDMSLDVMGGGERITLRVKVLESAPVIVSGSVRHRIRLAVLDDMAKTAAQQDAPLKTAANSAPAGV